MMLDDLDLEFEPRGRRRKPKKKRGRSVIAFLLAILLLGGLSTGAYVGYRKVAQLLTTPDYAGTGVEEIAEIEIKAGATQAEIAQALSAAGVIKSDKAFTEAGKANQEALKIQPGHYQLRRRMSGAEAVRALLDPKNRVVRGILIREGLITVEIYALLAKELGLDAEDLKRAAKDPVRLGVPDWWFNRKDGVASAERSLEGFLFPATYEFPPKVTAEQALRLMVQKFLAVAGQLKFADRVQKERNISPYEALIAASIVEAEVAKPDDMRKAARAVYNRVYTDKHDCKCLQLDAAINYHFKVSGQKAKDPNEFRVSEIQNPHNPYNTHIRPGMPISPISNPGETALKAAMDTPPGDWLYWVTVDKQGTTLFADSYQGHLANIRIACHNGVLSGPAC